MNDQHNWLNLNQAYTWTTSTEELGFHAGMENVPHVKVRHVIQVQMAKTQESGDW